MAKKTIEKKITLGRDAEGKLIRRNVCGKTKKLSHKVQICLSQNKIRLQQRYM